MNKIYIIHFGMGQKAIEAYECPLGGTLMLVHLLFKKL